MILTPIFKNYIECVRIPNVGVVFLSERFTNVVPNKLYIEVCDMINGVNSSDYIIKQLSDKHQIGEIHFILSELERKNYIQENTKTDSLISCFDQQINDFFKSDVSMLSEINLINISDIDDKIYQDLLSTYNIRINNQADYTLVITDNYLDKRLAMINNHMLADKKKWFICKPTGSIIFIGPLFQSTTACWGCLKARLSSHDPALLFLSKHGYTDKVRLPVHFNKFSLNIAFTLCLFNLAIKASMSRVIVQDIDLLSYDLFTNGLTTHVLGRIESCEVCNNGSNYQIISEENIKIEETNTYTPAKFLSQLEKLISPITGIVSELSIKETWQEGLFYLAYAYHPLITRFEDIESFLGNFGSITSYGKGKTVTEAKIGAIGEAVERYSGVLQGNEKIINASLAELGKQAIHPNDVLLISDEQYLTGEQAKQPLDAYRRIPLVFPDDKKFNWSPVIALTNQQTKYLPTAFCYYSSNQEERPYIIANSNGSAARDTKENALIYGFLELFERDAVAIWWYNRLSMPGVDLQRLDSDFVKRVAKHLCSLERNLWVLNITNDLNVPVFVALSKCQHIERQDIIFGFGCHFDSIVAIEKAVLELLQVLESVFDKDDDGTIRYVYSNVDAKKWWDEARTNNQPYLLPKDNISNDLANYNFVITKDNNSLENCINIIKKARLEAYYIDQTRKDIGVAVVKVIVPGLRHLGRSFAPGRLFDVPVKMGWTKKPILEKYLNPYPIFF